MPVECRVPARAFELPTCVTPRACSSTLKGHCYTLHCTSIEASNGRVWKGAGWNGAVTQVAKESGSRGIEVKSPSWWHKAASNTWVCRSVCVAKGGILPVGWGAGAPQAGPACRCAAKHAAYAAARRLRRSMLAGKMSEPEGYKRGTALGWGGMKPEAECRNKICGPGLLRVQCAGFLRGHLRFMICLVLYGW